MDGRRSEVASFWRADGPDQSAPRDPFGARNRRAAGKRKLEQFLVELRDQRGGAGLTARMIMLVDDTRAQAGPDRLGGAASTRVFCRQETASGGIAIGRSGLEGADRSMRFARG